MVAGWAVKCFSGKSDSRSTVLLFFCWIKDLNILTGQTSWLSDCCVWDRSLLWDIQPFIAAVRQQRSLHVSLPALVSSVTFDTFPLLLWCFIAATLHRVSSSISTATPVCWVDLSYSSFLPLLCLLHPPMSVLHLSHLTLVSAPLLLVTSSAPFSQLLHTQTQLTMCVCHHCCTFNLKHRLIRNSSFTKGVIWKQNCSFGLWQHCLKQFIHNNSLYQFVYLLFFSHEQLI